MLAWKRHGAAGRLRTRVSAVLPLQDASQAHRRAEAGRLHGKILLSPKLDLASERARAEPGGTPD